MRARGLALLDDGDRDVAETLGQLRPVLEELARADRRGEAGRAAADDQDADVDPLVGTIRRRRDELPGSTGGGKSRGRTLISSFAL